MVRRRRSSPYEEILTRVESPPLSKDFRGLPPDVGAFFFCDEIEEAIAAKQLLVEWHQSQIAGDSPAEKAADIQRIKELQEEIRRLQQQLEFCIERPPAPVLAIAGVERTQATQYFFINGQGSNFASNNSIPFISNRALLLRVYVDDRRPRSVSSPVLPQRASGRVRYQQVGSAETSVLDSLNGSVSAKPIAAVDRGRIGDTLNFRIPALDCQGELLITVDIFDASRRDPETGFVAADASGLHPQQAIIPTDSLTFFVRFEPVPAFAVRVVLIYYRGGGQDLREPSGLQFASDLLLTLESFPIGRLVIEDCVIAEFFGDLRDTAGPGWDQLYTYLRQMNGNSSTICVGLLPKGVLSSVAGIGGGGVAAAIAGDPQTLAQEIGHALGRLHAPNPGCPGFLCPPGLDPNYPKYDNSVPGSIGEFGVRLSDLTVFNPRFTLDLMSYPYLGYEPGWVSPYTFMGLWLAMFSRFGSASRASLDATLPPQAWLHLEFSVDREGAVMVHPSFIRDGAPTPAIGFGATPISCELVDASGRVIHWHRCTLRDPYQDVEGPSLFLSEPMPWSSTARTIRIRRDGALLATIEIEDVEPRIAVATPKVTPQTVSIEWRAEHPGQQPLAYLVEYSNDDGRTWRGVARSSRTQCEFNLDFLAGGQHCKFRVFASSGVRTASAESETFAVPPKPRRAFILSPATDEQIAEGQSLVLRGGGFAPGLGLADQEQTLWMSSVDGTLGYGYEVACRLSDGLHKVTLIVPDGLGGRASAEVTVGVRDRASNDGRDSTPR